MASECQVMTKIPQVRNGTVACTYANLDINYHGSFWQKMKQGVLISNGIVITDCFLHDLLQVK